MVCTGASGHIVDHMLQTCKYKKPILPNNVSEELCTLFVHILRFQIYSDYSLVKTKDLLMCVFLKVLCDSLSLSLQYTVQVLHQYSIFKSSS